MKKMEPFRSLYEHKNHKPFVFGKVVRVRGPRALILTPYNTKVIIDVSEIPQPVPLQTGTVVRAIGEWEDDIFYSQHILVR